MRWFWIDRFIEFHSGRDAKAVKNVTLSAEHLHDHFPEYPLMPGSLVIEGMGQTGMFLAIEVTGYRQMILLAKIASARFFGQAVPGDTLVYVATLNAIKDEGISASVAAWRNDGLFAEADLVYTRFSHPSADSLIADLLEMARAMRLLGVFAVGTAADGTPLAEPAILAEADRAA